MLPTSRPFKLLLGCAVCREAFEPGWLCEDHLGQPWGHEGCSGAGAPCVCNPTGALEFKLFCAEPLAEEQRR
jgi:hypothetical protein